MTKGQASKATDAQGCNRCGSDAGRCRGPACAKQPKQPVHDTANERGLDRAACSASNTGLDGWWHCLPSMLSVRGAAKAGRAEAAASAADARARYTSSLHKRAIPNSWTTAHHQGTKPQKEHQTAEGACLIHGRHARRVPAPYVLIERRCRVERLGNGGDRGNVPAADVLVEGGCSIEHICQVRHPRHIPPPDVLVECRRRLEHRA